ncbi:right-handed parallel beta-helix repeat-containing protein [Planctomycetota bacterium]
MKKTISLALLLAMAGLAQAATITVGPGADYDFNAIQAGIDAAVDGDTMLVTPAEYVITESIAFRGKAITVKSEAGPDETTIRMSPPRGSRGSSVVIFENGETTESVLEGFTITGGTGSWVSAVSAYAGGGIYFNASSGTLRNCVVVKNKADVGGGGGVSACFGASPFLTNCIFMENSATWGGGVHCWNGCSIVLTNCIIAENSADESGGGVYCYDNSSVTLTNCEIMSNTATIWGGGLYVGHGSATLTNCLIARNSGLQLGGGGIVSSYPDTSLSVRNCTIWGNSGGFSCPPGHELWGGGGVLSRNASATVTNSIVWGNTSPVGSEISVVEAPSTLTIAYSNLGGGQTGVNVEGGSPLDWGPGNIDADPLFARLGYMDDKGTSDPSDDVWVEGDFHLKSQAGRWDSNNQTWVQDGVTSPCIDAGDPMSPIGWECFPNGGFVNMGAYAGTPEASKTYFDQPICETIVAGDINGDGQVNRADLEIMALHWTDEEPLPLP